MPLDATEQAELYARLRPALPRNNRNQILLTVGDSYTQADGRPLEFSPRSECETVIDNGWPDLTGATPIELKLCECPGGASPLTLTVTGSAINPTGQQLIRFEPSAAQTATLRAGRYTYTAKATLASGSVITLETGLIRVEADC